MRKLTIFLGAIILIVLAGFGFFITYFAPIISGFGAKALCSCVYNGQRSAHSVLTQELGAFPLKLGSFSLGTDGASAQGNVFGFAPAKAIYRPGLGCTLLRGKTEKELAEQEIPVFTGVPLSDTVYWPNGTKRADSMPLDINPTKLAQAMDFAFTQSHPEIVTNTRGVVVVYKGQLIAERYAAGFDARVPQVGWSMTKSVTSILLGIMQKNGSLDRTSVTGYGPWQNDSRKDITYTDLLQMNSGLDWQEVYSNVSTATKMIYEQPDMGRYAASLPAAVAPQHTWVYSSGTTNILTMLMREKLGDARYYAFAWKALFQKIGVTTAIMEVDPAGNFVASSYMWASAPDWARLGQLYLQQGNWNGEQLVDTTWVDFTRTLAANTPKGEYGGHFWLNKGAPNNEDNRFLPSVSTDLYMMRGYEGQRVYILPSSELVVVRLGQEKRGGFDEDTFLSMVVESIEK